MKNCGFALRIETILMRNFTLKIFYKFIILDFVKMSDDKLSYRVRKRKEKDCKVIFYFCVILSLDQRKV